MRKFLTALSFILLSTTVDAEVKLPPIFGDNMVLQQKSDAALWGSARPGATVVISPSWSASKIKVKTDDAEDIERWLDGEDGEDGDSEGDGLPDDNISQYSSEDDAADGE